MMLHIEPIITSKQTFNSKGSEIKSNNKDGNNKAMLSLSLTGLAAIGLAAIGLKKTSIMTYEEALRKNGVEIKNGIATLIKSGEKFTGKIQRFEKRNRKESVEFVDGVMTEKLYHNILGKELDGYFYKNGACYKVNGSRKLFTTYLYIDNRLIERADSQNIDNSSVFEKTRKYIASPSFDKLVQETREIMDKTSAK